MRVVTGAEAAAPELPQQPNEVPGAVEAAREPAVAERALAGDLGHRSFAELLHELHNRGASGVLELRSGKRRKHIALRAGRPVGVKSNLLSECFGNLLVRRGRISEADMEESFSRSRRGEGRQGEVLVAMDVLEGEEVSWSLRMQSDEKFFEVFGWSDGHYRFHPNTRLAGGSPIAGERSLGNLVLEGVRTRTPKARIEAFFCADGERLVSLSDHPVYPLRELDVASDFELLSALDGGQTLAECGGSEPSLRRTLYALVLLNVLELGPQKRQAPAPPPDAVAALHAALGPMAARAAGGPDAAPARHRPQVAGQAESARQEEAERHYQRGLARLRAKDHAAAVESLLEAVRLEPENGEIHAYLGWALYVSDPQDGASREVALQHMRRGAKLADTLAKPYVFLGRVYRALGQDELARRLFSRATQNEPGCMEALRELRLLNLRREKKGLLGRLFRRS